MLSFPRARASEKLRAIKTSALAQLAAASLYRLTLEWLLEPAPMKPQGFAWKHWSATGKAAACLMLGPVPGFLPWLPPFLCQDQKYSPLTLIRLLSTLPGRI